MLTLLKAPVSTSQERPFDETDFTLRGNDNSSNERPPSVLSVIQSVSNGEEPRLSGSRPPSLEVISRPSTTTGGLPTQDVNNGSNKRPPSVLTIVQSLTDGAEPRLSGARPPSVEDILQPTQDVNQARSDPNGSHIDDYDAYAGQKAVHHHHINLVQTYKLPEDPKPKPMPETKPEHKPKLSQKSYMQVSFAELQRMRLRKLQIKLVRHAVRMRYSNKESQGWEETLKQYSTVPRLPPH
jgi:hypothetical protein